MEEEEEEFVMATKGLKSNKSDRSQKSLDHSQFFTSTFV
jgi:hypothetical protein